MVIFPKFSRGKRSCTIRSSMRSRHSESAKGDTNLADKGESCLYLTLMALTSWPPSTIFSTTTYSTKNQSSTALEIGLRRLDPLFSVFLVFDRLSQAEHASGREQTKLCSFLTDLPNSSFCIIT